MARAPPHLFTQLQWPHRSNTLTAYMTTCIDWSTTHFHVPATDLQSFNSLECKGIITVPQYEVGTLAVVGCAVILNFGTARMGLGGAAAHSSLYQM